MIDERRVKQIFDEVLELEGAARQRALEARCDSPELRRRVEVLLARAATAGDFLEPGGLLEPSDPANEPLPSWSGRQVGPYRLLHELGRGGSSVVYLGERIVGDFNQRVAIKLLRIGLATEAAVQRFQRERQILAALQHPAIVRLVDGGTTRDAPPFDGVPFVAMDWVDGLPITTFADANSLSIRQRCELFLAVCEAVEFAHRQLIIHRDIKPSNVFVTDDGRPQLLDFGIAKLLAPDDDDPATAQRMMTVRYASPEQLRGAPLSVATDVYSLGVLLFELLTGRSPHRAEQAAERSGTSPPHTPAEALGKADPADGTTSIAGVAERRGTSPAALLRSLSGELTSILIKAMSQDPKDRYGSVEALRQDLQRFLTGRPVQARAQTSAYRLWKFVRRNPLPSTLLVALTLALGGLVVQSSRLASQRDLALARQEKAEDVTRFLVETLELVDPYEAQRESVQIRDLLAGAGRRGDQQLGHRPEVLAALHGTLGQGYQHLGLESDAQQHFETAIRLARTEAVDAADVLADSLLATSRILAVEGEHERAEASAREGLALRSGLDGPAARSTAEAHSVLAAALLEAGQFEEAVSEGEIAAELLRGGPPSIELAEALTLLARIHEVQGAYDLAGEPAREGLLLYQQLLGDEHPSTAAALDALANALYRQGRYAEAEAKHRQALELRRRHLRPDHPNVIHLLNNLGLAQMGQGHYEAAQETFEEALALRRTAHGAEHPLVARSLHNLASVLRESGRPGAALEPLNEALGILEAKVGRDHPETANVVNTLALVYRELGDLVAAEPLYRRSLAAAEANQGEATRLVPGLINLGALLVELGSFSEGQALVQQAHEIYLDVGQGEHPYVAASGNVLAHIAMVRGDFDRARQLYQKSVEICAATFGEAHPWTLISRVNVAEVQLRAGELAAATRALRDAAAAAEESLQEPHPEHTRILHLLGASLVRQGERTEGEKWLREAAAEHERNGRAQHVEHAEVWLELAALEPRSEDSDASREALRRARAILEARLPADHWLYHVAAAIAARQPHRAGDPRAARDLRGAIARLTQQLGPEAPVVRELGAGLG
ncbi:MAG: serine/threonine-protein kinase [Acidobacteriota bacterium]